MKYKRYFYPMFVLCICLLSGCQKKSDTTVTSIQVLDQTYHGTLEGSTGIFTSDAKSDRAITAEGTWENGILQGNASVTYFDGSSLQGNFDQGLLSGTVTSLKADGTSSSYRCTDGKPHGLITNYDAEHQITSYDWFYQMEPIETLNDVSSIPEYRTLLSAPSDYMAAPLKISGIVQAVYDTESRTYIKLADSDGNLYACTYLNTIPKKFTQARIPNLTAGDSVTVMGFLQECSYVDEESLAPSLLLSVENNRNLPFTLQEYTDSSMDTFENAANNVQDDPTAEDEDTQDASAAKNQTSDTESYTDTYSTSIDADFNNTLPIITLFYGELQNVPKMDRLSPSYTYEEICRYPYHYAGMTANLTGTIINQVVNYTSSCIELLIQEKNTKNLYYSNYYYSEGDGGFPTIGDTVKLSGTFKGNYKCISYDSAKNISYGLCPRILIKKFKIL